MNVFDDLKIIKNEIYKNEKEEFLGNNYNEEDEPQKLMSNKKEELLDINYNEADEQQNLMPNEKKESIRYFRKKKEGSFWNFFVFFNCCLRKEEEVCEFNFDNNNNKAINNKLNNSNNNKENDKEKKNKIKNLENKDDIMKIINNQDYIEGFWEYNEQTKYIKDKYLDKFNLIKGKLNLIDKTIMTILIIYFIEKEHIELLKELDLIIQKGKIYIQKETNKSYEEIINIIGI